MRESQPTVWDDLDTLVFDRDEIRRALEAVRAELDRPSAVAPITPLYIVKDEAWLEELPQPTRSALVESSELRDAWPKAPRLAFAVATPAES